VASFRNRIGRGCTDFLRTTPCERYISLGFSHTEVYELLANCPHTCGICEPVIRPSLLVFISDNRPADEMLAPKRKPALTDRTKKRSPVRPPMVRPTIPPARPPRSLRRSRTTPRRRPRPTKPDRRTISFRSPGWAAAARIPGSLRPIGTTAASQSDHSRRQSDLSGTACLRLAIGLIFVARQSDHSLCQLCSQSFSPRAQPALARTDGVASGTLRIAIGLKSPRDTYFEKSLRSEE